MCKGAGWSTYLGGILCVGKDGFMPISVKPMTNATRLNDNVV
jgi:hypothetical protein